ncbi:MAG: alkaline phosphatase family protein [Anaerolineales bacterium]
MADLTKKYFSKSLESDLESQLNEVDFVYPRYDGESILNILPSVAELFNVKGFQHPGLKQELLDPLRGEPDNIILVLLDALAYHRMAHWLADGNNPGWSQIKNTGLLAPLTSISPSTTCAAITSFWTDSAAIQHGILGYEMWLKEFGITANMIEHKPITYRSSGGNLRLAGFDPETFLPVKSIA